MSKIVRQHVECPDCGSSDALCEYDDGHTHCFSCNRTKGGANKLSDQGTFTYEYLPHRGIKKETFELYKVKTKINEEGEPIAVGFPYRSDACKVRMLSEKKFYTEGNFKDARLFGKESFSRGSSRSVILTEGEFDAMAVFDMLDGEYPVLSVRSASSAKRDCADDMAYLEGFDRIYLCFDSDEPGEKATAEVATLFDFNKVYHLNMTKFKDANEYLLNGSKSEFKEVFRNARRFIPTGVISSHAEIENILNEKEKSAVATYPFKKLQQMTYGLRTGEIVVVKAPEGVGKTEFIRAIEYHVLQTTDVPIGVIHMEESKTRLVKGMAGIHLDQPVHLPDSNVSPQDILQAYKDAVKKDDRLHIYSHFSSEDPDVILSTIRFLASACGCKFIFLDHISQMVSGQEDDNERRTIDRICTKLAFMVEELDFNLVMISHVNDNGQTRSSRYITKVADLVLNLDRDKTADTEEERNTTKLMVEKNRFGAMTGPAGELYFDFNRFRVIDKEQFIPLPPTEIEPSEPIPDNYGF